MRHMGMIVVVCGIAGVAAAGPIPDGGVTVEDVAAVMQAKGYRAEITADSQGDPKILSSTAGKNFSVFFYGCSDVKRCTAIQFSAGFDLKQGMTLAKINEWNFNKRFATGSLDDEMDPYMSYDIDVEHGYTTEAIANNLDRWEAVVGKFKTFIDY